jgi:tetratricopeptide (TPR) repeat protein
LKLAQSVGVEWLAGLATTGVAAALQYGSLPIDEAIGRLEVLIPPDSTSPATLARKAGDIGVLLARRGDVAAGLASIERCEGIIRELRGDHTAHWLRGIAYWDACMPERALPHFVEAVGNASPAFAYTICAVAAHVLAELGRWEEAESYVSRATGRADHVGTRMVALGALARLQVGRGDAQRAYELAQQAAELADGTDFTEPKGHALIDVAWVELKVGKPREACLAAEQAVDLLNQRGALPLRDQAQDLLTNAEQMASVS